LLSYFSFHADIEDTNYSEQQINNQGTEHLANALKNNKVLPFLSHTYFMYCVIQTLKTLDLQSSQGVRVRMEVRVTVRVRVGVRVG